MPLSQALTKALNAQIGLELYASHVYLQFSAVARRQGCANLCKRYLEASEEEREHAQGIVRFLDQRDAQTMIPPVDAPPAVDFRRATAAVLALEEQVTAALIEIQLAAESEKDRQAYEFLSGYVAEQTKGEDEARQVLAFFANAGDLVTADQQVGQAFGG